VGYSLVPVLRIRTLPPASNQQVLRDVEGAGGAGGDLMTTGSPQWAAETRTYGVRYGYAQHLRALPFRRHVMIEARINGFAESELARRFDKPEYQLLSWEHGG
jgi:hypothetical protein